MSFRRPTAYTAAALCVAIASLALNADPAFAEITHLYDSGTTSAFGHPFGVIGVAVDQSDGSVYEAELESHTIRKFSSAGIPDASYGGGTGALSVPFGPWEIAVDQTSRDLYVPDPAGAVYKFDPEGNPVVSFGTSGQIGATSPMGIAVDPSNDDIYVASSGGAKVEVFTSSGTPVTEFSTDKVTVPAGIAVDGSGRIYVAGGGYFGGSGVLERFSGSGAPEGVIQTGGFQDVTIDPANEDIYTSTEGELTQLTPGGESVIDVFGLGRLNENFGVAVNETSGEVYAGGFYSSIAAFGPLVTLPNVTTAPPSAPLIGHTTATLTGTIDPAGGPPVTECAIEYGATDEYSSGKVPCDTATPIKSETTISATLKGLTTLAVYHYRVSASNEYGTSYGQDQTVEPPAVSGMSTGPATNVEATEAELAGSFNVDQEGGDTEYYFVWGLSKEYGTSTPLLSTQEPGIHQAAAILTNLGCYTLYHYRLVATNALGTSYGPDQTFHTKAPSLPSIDDTESSDLTPGDATLEAAVNPGFGATVVDFEYGPTASYGLRSAFTASIGEDDVDHRVSSSVTQLQPATTYHYRAIAINFAGVSPGPDKTFNTTALPAVSESDASAIEASTATLNAQIKAGFSPTTYRFEYGISAAFGQTTPEGTAIGSDDSAHAVSASLVGLVPATTYHYRILATNKVGTTEGPDEIFTTVSPPEKVTKVSPPIRCRRGHILKQGRCVRKSRSTPKHHKRSFNNHGGAAK